MPVINDISNDEAHQANSLQFDELYSVNNNEITYKDKFPTITIIKPAQVELVFSRSECSVFRNIRQVVYEQASVDVISPVRENHRAQVHHRNSSLTSHQNTNVEEEKLNICSTQVIKIPLKKEQTETTTPKLTWKHAWKKTLKQKFWSAVDSSMPRIATMMQNTRNTKT